MSPSLPDKARVRPAISNNARLKCFSITLAAPCGRDDNPGDQNSDAEMAIAYPQTPRGQVPHPPPAILQRQLCKAAPVGEICQYPSIAHPASAMPASAGGGRVPVEDEDGDRGEKRADDGRRSGGAPRAEIAAPREHRADHHCDDAGREERTKSRQELRADRSLTAAPDLGEQRV